MATTKKRSGAAINRGTSPMVAMEENFDDTKTSQNLKRTALLLGQQTRSPFLVGSIDEVNQKISSLGEKLQTYPGLVAESRTSDLGEEYQKMMAMQTSNDTEKYQKKVKETKEVNQFAGLYSMKATFIPGVSDRVKNISKISMKTDKQAIQKDTGKPKFIELHQFPGFDEKALTPLPHGVKVLDVLSKVANAQPKLRRKSSEAHTNPLQSYRPEFERLFYSPMSQAILQDVFWWLFLDKYQSNKNYQLKLFNRVAHNYVPLMTYSNHPQYKEAFLSDYPMLLSQSVYAAFCSCFPDSYRQFDEHFKEDLVNLVYDWVTGVRPVPRIWLKWNLDRVEPKGIKIKDEIMSQSKGSGKASLLNFDFLDSMTGAFTDSQSTLERHGSMSSISSRGRTKQKGIVKHRASNSSMLMTENKQDNHQLRTRETGINQEAEESNKNKHRPSRRLTRSRMNGEQENNEHLAPIREFDEDEVFSDNPDMRSKSLMHMLQPPKKKKVPTATLR